MSSKNEVGDTIARINAKCKSITESCNKIRALNIDKVAKSIAENVSDLNAIVEQMTLMLEDKDAEVYKEVELSTDDAAFIESLNKETTVDNKVAGPVAIRETTIAKTPGSKVTVHKVDVVTKTGLHDEESTHARVEPITPTLHTTEETLAVSNKQDSAVVTIPSTNNHVDIRKSIADLQEKLDKLEAQSKRV